MSEQVIGFQQSVKDAVDTWVVFKNKSETSDSIVALKVKFWVITTTLYGDGKDCSSCKPIVEYNRGGPEELEELDSYESCRETGKQIAGVMGYMYDQKTEPTQEEMIKFIEEMNDYGV